MIGPVHEELLIGLEGFTATRFSDDNLAAAREVRRDAVLPIGPLPGVIYEERHIPGPTGAPQVRVLVYQPEAEGEDRPAILHFHGGGLIVGLPEMGHERNGQLARELNCVVVSVDYRKAPEAPFPAGPEDGWAALSWLRANAQDLGVDPSRWALLGESAGGCMAATMAFMARDRAGPAPLLQVLVYPMLDDRSGQDPVPAEAECLVWTDTSNRYGWSAYLDQAAGGADVPVKAVPARRDDLAGLAPAWIGVGSIDLFAQENLDYARRLLAAGVDCEFLMVPGAYHAFQKLVPDAPISLSFEANYQVALRRALTRAPG
ncbi:alpha/beta hydrolase [Pseudooceanicola sp.]|uniref:alpha/beta hydrolase n=1 Tax=Pseudooceanicola sp. TaxID=1914328 RepID=UPI002628C0E0|nr:alpha/beta hydrolase [Pseudooceanicola sp.]MDF1854643.1 alpha/beta hydrolase [Pseudooceanicola sp.]